jgi:hypothetical protein
MPTDPSPRFRKLHTAMAVAAGTAALAIIAPLALSHAAQGTVVSTAPGTVFNLGGCTGFAISQSVMLTAKHCEITPGTRLVSMTGESFNAVEVIDAPGVDAQAVVSDATDLVPFSISPPQPGVEVTVFGYGRSRDDAAGGAVMRQAVLGAGHPDNGAGTFDIDMPPQGDTVCQGDSGGPAVQGGAVTGIIVGGDAATCATALAQAVSAQPVVDWLRSQGVL